MFGNQTPECLPCDLGKKRIVAFPEIVAGFWCDCLARWTYFVRKMGIVFKMSHFSDSITTG